MTFGASQSFFFWKEESWLERTFVWCAGVWFEKFIETEVVPDIIVY